MADEKELASTVAAAAAAVSGPNTPDSVHVSNNEDRMTLWTRNLAGPAICGMIAGVIAILSFGSLRNYLWTNASEVVRVHYVGAIGIALALMIGVLVWRLDGSKLRRLDIKMGPGSLSMGDDDDNNHRS